jgi:tetratricopeptide (TPR) repeat protein
MSNARVSAVCVAILASAMVVAGCGGAQSRFTSHMDRGNQYFAQGEYGKAGVEFRNAMQIVPTNTEARVMAGLVLEKQGKLADALNLYQAAVDTAPESVRARANLGRMYVFAGESRRANEVIGPALAKHPDDPDLLAVRAAVRQQLKDQSGALEDAQRAVKLAPSNENAIALLAGLYNQAADKPRAIALLSDGVSKIPGSADLRQVLASLYFDVNEPDRAEEQLRKLVELKPKDLAYRNQLAVLLVREHKLDDAQRVLEQAAQALPDSNEAKLGLVDFLVSQRTREQGEKVLRNFIAREPDNFALQLGLGSMLQHAGATKEAVAAYHQVIAHDERGPSGLTARDRIAVLALAEGRTDEAQRLIAEVLKRNPRDDDALAMRADIELKRNDPTAAIADLRAVLRDQPKAIGLRMALARAYRAHGEPALAEEALRAAMEIAPANFDVRIDLAELLTQTDRADKAITLLEEMVRSEPKDQRVRVILTRAYLAKRDFAAARTSADDLETLIPNSPVGFYLAGLVAQAEGRLSDSERELDKALTLSPGNLDVVTARSQLDIRQGRAAQAVARVQSEVEHHPDESALLELLGETYVAAKDYPHAVQTLTRTIQLAPNWWLPHRDLATARLATKDTAGAIAAYESGVKAAPAEPQLVIGLADLYASQGRIDDAIARYEALYALNPRLVVVANNLAMLLVNHKTDPHNLDRAKELTAAFASSDSASLLDTNGWVKFKRGEVQEALPVLEKAVEREPESPVIRYHLAMAQLKTGQRDKARTNLQTALGKAGAFEGSEDARLALVELKGTAG